MQSCLYEGEITHHRLRPIAHRFRYRMAMAYLDLDELPCLMQSLRMLGQSKLAPVAFLEQDHFDQLQCPLIEQVRTIVLEQTGSITTGPVRLLTQLRCFGYYFSPLNLYYCFSEDEKSIDAVVAEVSNTPWLETHRYVLRSQDSPFSSELSARHQKEFHVSPFMGMDLQYEWHLTAPTDSLGVQILTDNGGPPFFSARLNLQRHSLSNRSLTRLLIRYPFSTARIVTSIYWQAFRLWRKQCPYYPHPRGLPTTADTKTK